MIIQIDTDWVKDFLKGYIGDIQIEDLKLSEISVSDDSRMADEIIIDYIMDILMRSNLNIELELAIKEIEERRKKRYEFS